MLIRGMVDDCFTHITYSIPNLLGIVISHRIGTTVSTRRYRDGSGSLFTHLPWNAFRSLVDMVKSPFGHGLDGREASDRSISCWPTRRNVGISPAKPDFFFFFWLGGGIEWDDGIIGIDMRWYTRIWEFHQQQWRGFQWIEREGGREREIDR